jgi:hypothetical protein
MDGSSGKMILILRNIHVVTLFAERNLKWWNCAVENIKMQFITITDEITVAKFTLIESVAFN